MREIIIPRMRSRSIRFDRALELTLITSELKYGAIVFDADEVVTVDADIADDRLELLILVSCRRAYLIVQPRASTALANILYSYRAYFVLLKSDLRCVNRALKLRLEGNACRYTYDYFDGADLRLAFPHIREPLAEAEGDYSDCEEDYASQIMNDAEEICFEAYLSSVWMEDYLTRVARDNSEASEDYTENEVQEEVAPAEKPRPPQISTYEHANRHQMQLQPQPMTQMQLQMYAYAYMQMQMQAQVVPYMFYQQPVCNFFPQYAEIPFVYPYHQLFATQEQLCQQFKCVYSQMQQSGEAQISPERMEACTTLRDFYTVVPQNPCAASAVNRYTFASAQQYMPAYSAPEKAEYPGRRAYGWKSRDEKGHSTFGKRADGRQYSTQAFRGFMEDFMRYKGMYKAYVTPFVSYESAARLFEYAGGRACYKCENSVTGKTYCVCDSKGYKTVKDAEACVDSGSWVTFIKRSE